MDIKKIGISPSPIPMGPTQETKKNLDFQRILQEANQSVGASKTSPEPMATPPIQLPSQGFEIGALPGVLEAQPLEQLRAQGIRAAENTLNLLGKYQQALGDSAQTLKQINPLVESLSEKVEHLQKLTQQIDAKDPLQQVIREVGVVSAAEIEKFNRGDYV